MNRRTWLILAAILLIGLLVRISYLEEIKQAPDFASPLADAAFHDYWARSLLSGDWTPPAGMPDPRIQEVPFLRPPGYAYFLAGSYALTGRSYTGVRIVQMVLGLLNCVLAFLLGRALFNRSVGLIMAAFCAVYWALLYFEGELHAPVLLVTLGLLLILTLHRWSRRPSLLLALVAGIILGFMGLLRANDLLFAPVAAVWMVWCLRRQGETSSWGEMLSWREARRWIGPVALFLLGTALTIAPVTIRNAVVADDLFLVSANSAINLYIGNNEESDGVIPKIPDQPELSGTSGWSCFSYDGIVQALSRQEGRDMKYSEISSYFRGKAFDFITTHPLQAIQLTLKRAALFWGPDEVSNNKAIAFEKANSATLRFIPGFPFALAMSLLGLFLLVRDRRTAVAAGSAGSEIVLGYGPSVILVGLFVLTIFVSYLPFIVAARFRAPIVPFMFVFGAYGLYRFGCTVTTRDWRRAGALLAAGVALTLLAGVSLTGYQTDPAWWHTDRALAFVQRGDMAAAEEEFKAALVANPGFVDAHLNYGDFLAAQERMGEAVQHYTLVANNRPDRLDVQLKLGAMLTDTGNAKKAVVLLDQLVARNPNLARAYFELGRALNKNGQFEESVAAFRHYLEFEPEEASAYLNIGIALMRLDRLDEAIPAIRAALMKKPDMAQAYLWLGKAYARSGATEEAVAAFRQAVRYAPDSLNPLMNLGMLYSSQGDYAQASQWFQRAVRLDGTNLVARLNLAGALANGGKYDEAIAEFEAILEIAPGNKIAQQRLATVRQLQGQR